MERLNVLLSYSIHVQRSPGICLTMVAVFLAETISLVSISEADSFGAGTNTFDIEFVTIGNADNPDDMHGQPRTVGKVEYIYRMGKYEISEDMINKANAATASGPSPLNITHTNRGADKPATFITWFEAAKFVNWLNTSTNHAAAYKFDDDGNFQLWEPDDVGFNAENMYRNRLAYYFLPNVDEWYKAAYYDPDVGGYNSYATGSTIPTPVASGTEPNTAVYEQPPAAGPADVMLAGGLSPYGTMGQSGNVSEWEETAYFLANDSVSASRGIRGGDWDAKGHRPGRPLHTPLWRSARALTGPWVAGHHTGFRVASIPEPNTILLSAIATAWLWGRRSY